MKSIFTFFMVAVMASLCSSQTISLVQDVNPGTAGSVRGSSTVYDGDIYYVGFVAGQFGNQVIRYDRSSGSAAAITSVFNSFDILLAATDQHIYVTDDEVLYRLDPISGGRTELFSNPMGGEIVNMVAKGDVLVLAAESASDDLAVYAIKDDQAIVTELDEGNFVDDVEITINDQYIALKENPDFGSNGSSRDLLIDRGTLVASTEGEIAAVLSCGEVSDVTLFDDYIIYKCSGGDSYIRNVMTAEEFVIDGNVEDVRVGQDYIFLTLGSTLHSVDKTTGDLVSIINRIESIGNLNEEGTVLYFLREFETEIRAAEGGNTMVSSFEFGESTLGYDIPQVFTFGDKQVMLLDDGSDRFIKVIEADVISDLDDLGEIDINSTGMPFYKFGDELVFTYDDATYGPELFVANFMPTATVEDQLEEVIVTPSLVTDFFEVSLDERIAILEVYDGSGMLVKKLINAEANVDVSSLTAGIYTVRVMDVNSAIFQARFVKM